MATIDIIELEIKNMTHGELVAHVNMLDDRIAYLSKHVQSSLVLWHDLQGDAPHDAYETLLSTIGRAIGKRSEVMQIVRQKHAQKQASRPHWHGKSNWCPSCKETNDVSTQAEEGNPLARSVCGSCGQAWEWLLPQDEG